MTSSRLSHWVRVAIMRCIRCGGITTYERIYYGPEHFWVWKCIDCGEYIEKVILENRQGENLNCEKSEKKNGGFPHITIRKSNLTTEP
jgi:hypothetical protein